MWPGPVDADLVDLLCRRGGLETTVVLADGRRLRVLNIAWGYAIGDEHAHVTTNISPDVPGTRVDCFVTNNVDSVLDETSAVIFRARARAWHEG